MGRILTLTPRQFVFGYGSLAIPPRGRPDRVVREDGFVTDLAGVRREWGVAMDNRHDLPGYKYYTDAGGQRPAVFVAFLNLRFVAEGDGSGVNGLCLPVDDAALARLDLRERNYERIEVSARIQADTGGARVWAYVGTAAGRQRLQTGRRKGTAVIDGGYLAAVSDGFAALGEAEHHRCEPSLRPGDLPVVRSPATTSPELWVRSFARSPCGQSPSVALNPGPARQRRGVRAHGSQVVDADRRLRRHVHAAARRDDRQRRAAVDPAVAERELQRPAVGGRRLRADAGRAAADHRLAGGPVRPPAGVHDRAGHLQR